MKLRLKTCNNVKSVMYEMLPSAFLPAASKIKVQTILLFSIAGSMPVFWTVITSRKLQHVLSRPYKREAFQKVNYKLDLIEQPTP